MNATVAQYQAVSSKQQSQPAIVVAKILEHFNGDVSSKRIAVWGLEFEPASDIQNALVVEVIEMLLAAGASIAVHDPKTLAAFRSETSGVVFDGRVEFIEQKTDSIHRADALVVMADRDEYAGTQPGTLSWYMNSLTVFDTCDCFESKWFTFGASGFYTIDSASQPDQPLLNGQRAFFPTTALTDDDAYETCYEDEPVTFHFETYKELHRMQVA